MSDSSPREDTVTLSRVLDSIQTLERHMERKFSEQKQEMDDRMNRLEADIRQFSSREAIHADAVLRNKVDIMWKILTWGGTVVGAALLTALAALVIKTT